MPKRPPPRGRTDPDDLPYEVGYRKPPKHRRFKPGQSGNPRGRPKQAFNVRRSLKAALEKPITIREGERTRTVSRGDALVSTLVTGALRADPKALVALLALMRATGAITDEPNSTGEAELGPDDEALLKDYLGRQGSGS